MTAPGGRLEPQETPSAAALRELEEEVGVRAASADLRGELRFQFADGYALRVHVATADRFEGTPRETDEAVPFWVQRDAIPYERMWADDILWLPALLDGHAIDGCFVFDGDRMLSAELTIDGVPAPTRV